MNPKCVGYVANVRRCFPDRIRPKQFIYFFLLRNTVTCVWLLGFKIVTAFLYGECNLVVVLVQFCFFPSIMSGQMGWCVAFIRRPTNRPGHVFLVFVPVQLCIVFLAMCTKRFRVGWPLSTLRCDSHCVLFHYWSTPERAGRTEQRSGLFCIDLTTVLIRFACRSPDQPCKYIRGVLLGHMNLSWTEVFLFIYVC